MRLLVVPRHIRISEDILNFMRTVGPLVAPVFRSDAQARILAALLLQPEELSLTDLAAAAEVAYPTAHREVGRLLEAGILKERRVGRTRLLSANSHSPLTAPLRQLVAVTAGPVAFLREELAQVAGIESAFLFGSFAARVEGQEGESPGDVDVMVVGTPAVEDVYAVADRVQERVGRPVNVTILSQEEIKGDSGFLLQVESQPTIQLVGESPW